MSYVRSIRCAFLGGVFVAGLSGCYVARRIPIQDAPLVLQSATPMRIVVTNAEGAASPSPCSVLRATIALRQLRGDTLFFSRLEPSETDTGSMPCHAMAAGYIDLASTPSIRTMTYRPDAKRTALATTISVLGVLGVLIVTVVSLADLQ